MSTDNRPQIQPGPPIPALIAAGVVAGALLVIQIVQLLFGTLPVVATYGGSVFSNLTGFGWTIGVFVIPFAIGVFLALWLVVPVGSGQKLTTVLLRGVLASTAGAVVAAVVAVFANLVANGLHDLFRDVFTTLLGIVSTAVGNAPLVMLVLVVQHLVLARGASATGRL